MANIWKPVSSVWVGGTIELLKFKHSRVRVFEDCVQDRYEINGNLNKAVYLTAGQVGIITKVVMDKIYIGFLEDVEKEITTYGAMLKTEPYGSSFSVVSSWPNFREFYEIEV